MPCVGATGPFCALYDLDGFRNLFAKGYCAPKAKQFLPLLPLRRILFAHASKLGCEGNVSKRLGSPYRSGRSPHWVKVKNPKAPAVTREAEEDWGR
jgi:hypothetical protein